MAWPKPPWVLRDWHPEGDVTLQEWLARQLVDGLEPVSGRPGVVVIDGRLTHRYRMRETRAD